MTDLNNGYKKKEYKIGGEEMWRKMILIVFF